MNGLGHETPSEAQEEKNESKAEDFVKTRKSTSVMTLTWKARESIAYKE